MLPILLRLGPVTIYSLGFFLFLGFSLASFVVWKEARVWGASQEKVLDTLFATVFLSLIVGRLAHVWQFWPTFAVDYSRIFFFLKYPGLSLPAMLLGTVAISGLLAKQADLEVLWVWDIFATAGAYLALFGNFGCYLDGCYLPRSNIPLILTVLAAVLLVFLFFLRKKFATSVSLAELAKKRGFFFLCYLIFQLVSLLMTAWPNGFWPTRAVYIFALTAVLVILGVRYKLLFNQTIDAISHRRFKTS